MFPRVVQVCAVLAEGIWVFLQNMSIVSDEDGVYIILIAAVHGMEVNKYLRVVEICLKLTK